MSGPEQTWFGNFSQEHFEKLSKNMQQIYDILRDKNLTITCDPKGNWYGKAVPFPGVRKITLGSAWRDETKSYEKTQTLIHEAAHLAGVVDRELAENRKYGPACAKKLAMQNCFKAMRNAENYGYYTLNNIADYHNADPKNCMKCKEAINNIPQKCKVINYHPQRPCR
jgi:hypothetical protein